MPVTLPPKRGLPEQFKRRAALRELAREEAAAKPAAALVLSGGMSRKQAEARAKELGKEPLPHTRLYWERQIAPDYE